MAAGRLATFYAMAQREADTGAAGLLKFAAAGG